jgi:hypothetical protein
MRLKTAAQITKFHPVLQTVKWHGSNGFKLEDSADNGDSRNGTLSEIWPIYPLQNLSAILLV